jgi:hypothetical protein
LLIASGPFAKALVRTRAKSGSAYSRARGDGVTEIMKIGTPKGRRGCHVIEVIREALRHRSEARI